MTERKPPSPPPRFESYRPASERSQPPREPGFDPYAAAPQHGTPMHQTPTSRGRPPQDRRPAPRTERPSSLLRGLFYALVALFALAGGAVAVFVLALPTNVVRDRIVAEVKARTGHDLVIAGSASFTLYPSFGVALREVSFSGAPGVGARPLVTMAALDVSVELLPLLRREVKVKRLVLREPQFSLEIDGQGRKSWAFAALDPADARRVRLAEAAGATGRVMSDATDTAPAPRAPESTLARLEDLELGDVRIENGALRYSDARSGSAHEFGSINVDLALKSISSPLEAKGSASWKAKKIDFDATLTSVKAVLEERPAKLALAITSEDVEGAFDGTASFKDTLDAEGTLSGKSPSVRSLAKWLGTELSPSKGFGPLTAKGLVRGNDKTISLSNAEIALDGATARGQITLETAGTRPLVKANLKLTELNLNTYMSGGDAGPRAAAAPASPPKQDPASEAPAWSIDDLLEREQPGPKVKGFRERAGWSEDAIDLSALGLVDADAKLSVGRLFVRDIKFDQSELTVALKGGIFKTTFDDVRLYEGRGRGFVAIDASSPKTANVGANLTLEGISALPLLKDGAGIDWVSGKGRLAFALAGQGTNQRQIVETLNGKLDFSFTDGALVGFNIPQMVRGLGQGHLTELKSAPTEKTDFSELAATWTVAAGVAQNQDLRLISPLLRVTGAGAVMLPPREVDYTLKPKLVADLAGQGGQQNLAGLEVPVRVHGPWGKPKLKPDLAAVFKDPKAVDTIKEIGKQFKGKSASEIVKGLFGGGGAPSGDAQGAETQAGDQPGEKLPDQSQKR